MDLSTFIITVYCLVEDELRGRPRLRQRGHAPALSDGEVLTMEIVGEYLGLDTDTGLYRYFRRHYGVWFPALRRIDRSTFARQAANLWARKGELWQAVSERVAHDPALSIVDSFPIPVCRFARAPECLADGVDAFESCPGLCRQIGQQAIRGSPAGGVE